MGKDAKIDSHVHLGHACRIGERCLITATAVIASSVEMGDDVYVGVNATVARCTVGANARISLGAVVTQDATRGEPKVEILR